MLQKLSSALREYKKRNEAVTQEGERLRKSRDALEAKCGELRAAVEGLTVEVVPLRAEYKKKSSAVESAEKRLENAKLSITTGEQELMESKREVEAATKRSEDLQQQVVRLEKEKAKRETDRIALQVKHNGTLQNVVRLEKEIAQAGTTTRNVLSTPSQKELANAKSRTTLVEKDLVEIRKERDQLLVAVKGVGLEIERLDEERMGGEKLAKETSAILESTRKEMDSTRTRLEREVASLRDEKEDHLAVIRRLQEAEDRKRREVKITTKNGEEMERLKKDLEKTEVERNDFEERLLAQETEKKKIEQRIGEGEKERKILMANLKSSRAEKVQWAEDRSKSMLEKDSLRSVKSRVEQEVADLLLEQEKDQVKIRTLREGTDDSRSNANVSSGINEEQLRKLEKDLAESRMEKKELERVFSNSKKDKARLQKRLVEAGREKASMTAELEASRESSNQDMSKIRQLEQAINNLRAEKAHDAAVIRTLQDAADGSQSSAAALNQLQTIRNVARELFAKNTELEEAMAALRAKNDDLVKASIGI